MTQSVTARIAVTRAYRREWVCAVLFWTKNIIYMLILNIRRVLKCENDAKNLITHISFCIGKQFQIHQTFYSKA